MMLIWLKVRSLTYTCSFRTNSPFISKQRKWLDKPPWMCSLGECQASQMTLLWLSWTAWIFESYRTLWRVVQLRFHFKQSLWSKRVKLFFCRCCNKGSTFSRLLQCVVRTLSVSLQIFLFLIRYFFFFSIPRRRNLVCYNSPAAMEKSQDKK